MIPIVTGINILEVLYIFEKEYIYIYIYMYVYICCTQIENTFSVKGRHLKA